MTSPSKLTNAERYGRDGCRTLGLDPDATPTSPDQTKHTPTPWVNSHEELVEALRKALVAMRCVLPYLDRDGDADYRYLASATPELTWRDFRDDISEAEAALKKAGSL